MAETEVVKTIVATWENSVPENVTVWFCDATADPKRVAELVGREVRDRTPKGSLEIAL